MNDIEVNISADYKHACGVTGSEKFPLRCRWDGDDFSDWCSGNLEGINFCPWCGERLGQPEKPK